LWGGSEYCYSFGFADFASLRFVLELLIVEEQLFAGCENKINSTVDAL